MRKVKLLSICLFLSLAGVVYASDLQFASQAESSETAAKCCKMDADSCPMKKASDQKESASCCSEGASCCVPGSSCCASHKEKTAQANTESEFKGVAEKAKTESASC